MQVYAGFEWYNGTHYLKKVFQLEQDAQAWVQAFEEPLWNNWRFYKPIELE